MNQTFLEEMKKAETRIDALETELEQRQEETGGARRRGSVSVNWHRFRG